MIVPARCPHCDHTEWVEVKIVLFAARYTTSGKNAIEAEARIIDKAAFERRFERHYDEAGHKRDPEQVRQ